MAESINLVNTAADSFQTWVDRTNQVINTVSQDAVTANSTLGVTTGNATVNGYFGANNIVAAKLMGGVVGTPATMNVVSNLNSNAIVTVGNSTVNVMANSSLLQVANSTGNVSITPVSVVSGQTTINSIAVSVGNSSVNVVVNASNLTVGGNLTA